MFVGCRIGVLVQMKEKLAPYLVAMQCCAHSTNLAIQTFSSLSIVHCLEDLLQSLHYYFAKSPKRVLELQKVATFLNTKGNKILRSVQTRQLFPCKQVVVKYKTLIAKMSKDQIENEATRSNLQKLLDLELIFGLHSILSLLELVHNLIKYTQGKDVYICDFVEAIKMCRVKIYELYIDHECKFKDEAFHAFP